MNTSSAELLLLSLFRIHERTEHGDYVHGCYMCDAREAWRSKLIKALEARPASKKTKREPTGYKGWRMTMRKMACHYCGEPGGTIDHKIPKAQGGRDAQINCVPSCGPCNNFKGDKYTYEEFKAGAWKRRPFSGAKMRLG